MPSPAAAKVSRPILLLSSLLAGLLATGCSEPPEVRFSAERLHAAGAGAAPLIVAGLRARDREERRAAFCAAVHLPDEAVAGFVSLGGMEALCKVAIVTGRDAEERPLGQIAARLPEGASSAWLTFAVDHIGDRSRAARQHIEPAMITALARGVGADRFGTIRDRIAAQAARPTSTHFAGSRLQRLCAVLDAFGEPGQDAANEILLGVGRGTANGRWTPRRFAAWRALQHRDRTLMAESFTAMIEAGPEDVRVTEGGHPRARAGTPTAPSRRGPTRASRPWTASRPSTSSPTSSSRTCPGRSRGPRARATPAGPARKPAGCRPGPARSWSATPTAWLWFAKARAGDAWQAAVRRFPKAARRIGRSRTKVPASIVEGASLAAVKKALAAGKGLDQLTDHGRVQLARGVGDALRAGVWGRCRRELTGIAKGRRAAERPRLRPRPLHRHAPRPRTPPSRSRPLKWMKTQLTPAEATDAFFDRFRARNSYSVRQANDYVAVMAEINAAAKDAHICSAFDKAAKKARHAHRVDWMIKFVTVKTLARLGTDRALPTLARFAKDPRRIVETRSKQGREVSRKVIYFRDLAAQARVAIHKRTARAKATANLSAAGK